MRVRALVLKSTGDPTQRPRRIKLFVNKPTIGFDDAADAQEPEAAQIIELSDEQVAEGRPVQLRFVRFQNVNHLSVRAFRWRHAYVADQQARGSCRFLWRRTRGTS